jgi:hypothetical protein
MVEVTVGLTYAVGIFWGSMRMRVEERYVGGIK